MNKQTETTTESPDLIPETEPVQPSTSEHNQAKQWFFFPNSAEGRPFSVEAKSREEAEEANTTYLKKKENT